jgi:hypothetical protein
MMQRGAVASPRSSDARLTDVMDGPDETVRADLLVVPLAAPLWDASTDSRFRGPQAGNHVAAATEAARVRAQRVGMLGSGYRAVIDGQQVALVNLSLSGAQLRGSIRVLPDQPMIVKIGWPQDEAACTAIARVRWVQFEPDPSKNSGLYRVGLAFETWDVRGLKEIMRHLSGRP